MAENLGLVLGDIDHAGLAGRRRDADGHDAARESLSGRGDLRGRHVGIRFLDRVHAAAGGAAVLQPGGPRRSRSRSSSTILTTSMR